MKLPPLRTSVWAFNALLHAIQRQLMFAPPQAALVRDLRKCVLQSPGFGLRDFWRLQFFERAWDSTGSCYEG